MKLRLYFLMVWGCLFVLTGCGGRDSSSDAAASVAEDMSEAGSFEDLDELIYTSQPTERSSDAVYFVAQYDPTRDPVSDLKGAVAQAQRDNKRILLQVGGEWCGWCDTLQEFIQDNEDIAEDLRQNFVLVKVNYSDENKNEAFLSQYPAISWYPHFFVLDSDGSLLHSQSTADFGKGYLYDRAKFVAFLKAWGTHPRTLASAAPPEREKAVAELPAIPLGTTVQASPIVPTQDEYVDIPGSTVSLIVPAGFTLSDQFPGLVQLETLSSIMITELPVPVDETRRSFSRRELAARGMTRIRADKVHVDGFKGTLVHATSGTDTGTFRQWILIFGDESSTVMIVATTLQAWEQALGKTLEQTLLTAKWNVDRTTDPFDDLGFAVDETDNLRVWNRLLDALVLTKDGKRAEASSDVPVFVIVPSPGPTTMDDLETLANQQLGLIDAITGIENVTGQRLTVDGLPAYEIVADAKEMETDRRIRVYLTTVLDEDHNYVMIGLVGLEDADQYMPEFREIVNSFRRTGRKS